MADQTFMVGQEFPDVKAFRSAIKEAAIAQHFELRIIKSDLIRYMAKCATEGCPWKIRAVKLPNATTFAIRSLDGTHTCGKNALNNHHQASVDWIVSFIEDRLKNDITYKPKDILRDIQDQYGVTIPYKQAWRARERGLSVIYGSSEEGFRLLPSYCEELKKSNPGTFAELFVSSGDDRFERLFVSAYASVYGFVNGFLPVVGLGGIQLKSKYLGTLLVATSFDADRDIFPLAFGIVDVESDENWAWFLTELRKAIEINAEIMPRISFLSDGQNGVAEAVKRNFPTSFHFYCIRYLSESIAKEFKNNRLVHLLGKAACSTSIVEFRAKMAEIEECSLEAAKWLQQFDPSRWALAYSETTRFGFLSSNVEELSQWIVEARDLPLIQVIETILSKLRTEFESRRLKSLSWSGILAPSAEKKIRDSIARASTYRVLRSDEVEFEILSSGRSEIVNIGDRACSCREWQLDGIPCSHTVAALLSCQKDVYAFTEKCFSAVSYRETYAGEIFPIPGKLEWSETGYEARVLRPPKFRRAPGRPEKKRICVEEINREKHTVRCSRCNRTGHYKTTCKAQVIESVEQCR